MKLSAHGSFEVTPTHANMSSFHIYLCKHGAPLVAPRYLPRTAHLTRESDGSYI